MSIHSQRRDSYDPLSEWARPPPDETEEQRQGRLEREAQVKRTSRAIDNGIKARQRQAREKKRIVRVLLLGQSESGARVPFS